MQEHAAEHHGWETSPWPLVLSVGVLFTAPFAFSLYFVYDQAMLAVLSLGIGVVLTVLSVAGWIKEAITHRLDHPHVHLHEETVGIGLDAMQLFIVAEAFIFIAFFAAYWFTRLTAPSWPPAGTPHISMAVPVVMTIILVSSSITIHFAEEGLKKGNRQGFLLWLVITILLGAGFFAISANEWAHLMHEGFNFKTNIYSTSFFSITGFHGSHVFVGLGMFLCVLIPALFGRVNKTFVKSVSVYWHFVDIVWFFVVSQVYFW
ncbi:MAG: heme-copper oxidase subunit III [Thermodesulfobacteriota bacterium]